MSEKVIQKSSDKICWKDKYWNGKPPLLKLFFQKDLPQTIWMLTERIQFNVSFGTHIHKQVSMAR